ncbi:serine/threonine-protein kinase [Streptomyces sp. NPDC050534]|uniref:serine/threonine-protein kinase n=1 Tax=Streptomyces sp. NPDC050534 TaxID=3365625 RepID=UPI00379DDC6B
MTGDTPEQGEGRVIHGRYRLLRTLGAGGMGRVWLAYDDELACEVALKEIALPDMPVDEPAQRIARARSEARHAARLRGHPHVATVHDVVMHEGLPWIVMEYVPDAVDLQAVVRRSGPLPPAQVARIGLAVLDALTAGHRIGILHRDVKPANILLAPDASGDPYARVLLTDYGIALQPESREPRLTATAGILGTPGYLAPERARGEPPTPAADLFSLGATLYAAVEGRGPFDRHGDYATLTALLGEEPTAPVRAGELAPVLQGLLVKDPMRRSSPETVARGLQRVVQQAASAGSGAATPGWGASSAGGLGPAPGADASAAPQGYGFPPPGFGPPPEGFGAAAAAEGHGGQPGGPGTPHTPGAPPHTPHTPHTPPGGPDTPGARAAGPAALAGAPGGPPYSTWRQPGPQNPADPANPYAQGPASPYAQPPSPYAGGTPGGYGNAIAPTAPGTGGPVPGPRGPEPRRKRTLAIVALVVGAVLVVAGGTWGLVALAGGHGGGGKNSAVAKKKPSASTSTKSPPPTGPVLPYGAVVGLSKPLETGDCVKAVWSGTPFRSVPNLGVVDCAGDWPDGQVVAVDTADDYGQARAQSAKRCASQSKEVVGELPDAEAYAVLPTREGFAAAGSGTPCLVLGRHAAIGGEVGRFRDEGSNLWVGQMSVGDCWDYKEVQDGYKAPLTDCAKPHTEQVIGSVPAPGEMSYKNGIDNANKLCSNKFESTWAPGSERVVYGWVADQNDWDRGFTKAVCTVSQADNSKTTGKIPAPGAV